MSGLISYQRLCTFVSTFSLTYIQTNFLSCIKIVIPYFDVYHTCPLWYNCRFIIFANKWIVEKQLYHRVFIGLLQIVNK